MVEIEKKIEQVTLLLEEIKSQLNPLLNNAHKSDKQEQLEVVAKMTDKFDKIGAELPDEIRTLKFKLIQEIDQFKEAEELNEKLQNTLMPFILEKGPKTRKKNKGPSSQKNSPKQYGINVIDLIEAKIIEPNTKIINTVDGQEYEALITPNGKIKLVHNDTTTVYNSLSSAAKEIMGRPINGWVWWQIEDSSGRKDLDYYRQKFIRDGK